MTTLDAAMPRAGAFAAFERAVAARGGGPLLWLAPAVAGVGLGLTISPPLTQSLVGCRCPRPPTPAAWSLRPRSSARSSGSPGAGAG